MEWQVEIKQINRQIPTHEFLELRSPFYAKRLIIKNVLQ
jgi:hypothetical protein